MVAYITTGPVVRRRLPGSEKEFALQVPHRLIALGAAAAIVLAACSGSSASPAPTAGGAATPASATEAPGSQSPSVDYKACASFDASGLGDKGFNDLAMKGLEAAKAVGFTTAYTEATGAADYVSNIQRLMDEGCQSIVVVGFEQTQAAVDATLANEDIAFAQVDATWDETANGPTPANFTGLDFQVDEAATLAGYLAAGFSQAKKIGTYGGEQYSGVTRFMDGYYAGIKIYNERKGAAAKLLGWDAATQKGAFVGGDTPWSDLAKGEQLAKQFLDQGADIVGPVAGATGNASIKAMAAADKWAIGVDTDQALSLPEYSKAILTSAEKRIDVAVLDVIRKNAGGDKGGENYIGTLANGGVAISPFHDLDSQIPTELKAEVEQLSADIASGAVKVADYLK
jgi:basic membrane protein A